MSKYAENTKVTVEKSRQEIEALVKKNGGKNFCYLSSNESEVFVFEKLNRRVKFKIEKPERSNFNHKLHPSESQSAEYRRLFRVLLLRLKAKFESVNSSEITFDEEFLANIVDNTGATVWEAIKPTLVEFEINKLPKMLTSKIQ